MRCQGYMNTCSRKYRNIASLEAKSWIWQPEQER